jgi:hypothetical protein
MDISRVTYKIALVTVISLIYWVFAFICVQVFGLKVFGENLAQIFGLSIVGLCTVLAGAICVNIMHNLTIIAQAGSGEHPNTASVCLLPGGDCRPALCG